MQRFHGWAAIAPVCLLFVCARLSAAVITVDSDADAPFIDKGPVCTLRAAVASANLDDSIDGCTTGSGPDTIQFDPALAGGSIQLLFIGSNAAGNSALRISSDITIVGDPVDGITIDAGGGPAGAKAEIVEMRLFYIGTRADDFESKGDSSTPALTLENVTLTGGFVRGGNGGAGSDAGGNGGGAAGMGGAIFNDGYTLTLRNTTLFDNIAMGGNGGLEEPTKGFGNAGGGGGGMAGDGQAAQPEPSKGHINIPGAGGPPNGGTPPGGTGGFGGGGAGGFGVDNCLQKGVCKTVVSQAKGCKSGKGDPAGNGGGGGFGGGGGGGGAALSVCKGSDDGDGGNGGFGGGAGAPGRSFVDKGGGQNGIAGFGGGAAFDGYGGGGAGMGGAIFSDLGTVNIINSTISGNVAHGGNPSCAALLKGCAASSGTARGLGGGIFMYDGTLNMNNATLSENTALNGFDVVDKGSGSSGDGGAVYVFDSAFGSGSKSGASVTINNSILANSEANNDFDLNASELKGIIGSGDNNIIEDNGGFDGGAAELEPFLFSLADNDGPTFTHLPEGDPDNGVKGDQSPAIGGGNNATCETEDQRHFLRPAGPTCDIGAVEVGAIADDGDGVDPAVEDGAPNGGDGNNDGTIDSVQSAVASFPSATGNGYITLEITEDCGQLLNVTAVDPASLPANTGSGGQPVDYPFGLVQFEMPCEHAIVEVLFHNAMDLDGTSYDKYGPTVPGDAGTTAWYSLSDAGFALLTAPNTWTLDLLDGRLGDDTDGSDDTIFDQGGPGRLARAIPAADRRGLGLLIALLVITGMMVRRRLKA